ncbi:MAG: hypothetical protein DHS20C10_00210 [marine bacterium B5-7]|nr:MAG: hypothetical protein DHS20C10_00210 [marine bacterium B5-7]
MDEFFVRLSARKGYAIELMLTSLFANLLALASPLYVIQILQRYVANGVDGTLVTLTVGVVIAIILEFLFRMLRNRLASAVSLYADHVLATRIYSIFNCAKYDHVNRINKSVRQELMHSLDMIQNAYSAQNICTVLDLPFAVLFLLMITLLSPWLALIVCVAITISVLMGWLGQRPISGQSRELNETNIAKNSLVSSTIENADTIRLFNAWPQLQKAWDTITGKSRELRTWLEGYRGALQNASQSLTALMTVAIYAVGARLVVGGHFDIGVLIGTNILAARALMPMSRFAQMGDSLVRAQQAEQRLADLQRLPLELVRGTAKRNYTGKIVFHDCAFQYPDMPMPLFESLSLELTPGSIVAIKGPNAAGKTSMAKLLLSLMEPTRGQILVDDIDLRQVSVVWWRQQVSYLPQDLAFMNASLQDNLIVTNPETAPDVLNKMIELADLREFIDSSAEGLNTRLNDHGDALSHGIRKRIALARALMTQGNLVILDEPMDSLDEQGQAAVVNVLEALKQQGKTILLFGNDEKTVNYAETIIDLSKKPVPTVTKTNA